MPIRERCLLSLLIFVTFAAFQTSCASDRHSATGFRLPENGDPDRGRAAFVALQCYSCHQVSDEEGLPEPDAGIATVRLGGDVSEIRTDGYLVTSIIHPSHRAKQSQRIEDESPMPDYSRMTVRQLIDLVAYMQTRYRLVPAPPAFP